MLKTNQEQLQTQATCITALTYLSLSEIQRFKPECTEDWVKENPDEIKGVLHNLGLDFNLPYERQFVTHRNRFNEVVMCSRWVGYERQDKDWIESGYASQEAMDKVKGNKLLVDLYRTKGGMVEKHIGDAIKD